MRTAALERSAMKAVEAEDEEEDAEDLTVFAQALPDCQREYWVCPYNQRMAVLASWVCI